MSSGDTNFTPAVTSETTSSEKPWTGNLLPFEIINIIQMFVAFWILICMIIYGTKTRRWHKTPGSSSLNSGIIYTTCTVVIALYLPRAIILEVIFSLPRLENGTQWCETVCDASNGFYAVSTYMSYFYLWLLQRIIYTHPYVKERLGKYATIVSYFILIVLTAAAIALIYFYVQPDSYKGSPYGCVYRNEQQVKSTAKNLLLAVALFVAQLMVLALSIYPVVRVKFESSKNLDDDSTTDFTGERAQHQKERRPNCCQQVILHLAGKDGPKSPIEMSARRAMICSIVMVVTDIAALLPASLAFPDNAPILLRGAIFNIGSFINLFCVIATFGFAGRILTLLFPSCPKPTHSKIAKANGSVTHHV